MAMMLLLEAMVCTDQSQEQVGICVVNAHACFRHVVSAVILYCQHRVTGAL
jgi:hypothetical protein